MNIPPQINFTGKLEEVMVPQCFLSLKSNKNYPKLFFRSINCSRII